MAKFIGVGKHEKLCECIIKLLERVNKLEDGQVVGLLIASLVLGGAAWTSIGKALKALDTKRREQVLIKF